MEPAPQTPLACERFRARLQDALDERGSLEALERDPHLAGCPGTCRADLAAFRGLEQILASEPVAEPPGDLSRAVLERVRVENARARRRTHVSALVAAAAVLALGVGIDLFGGPLRAGFEALASDGVALAKIAATHATALETPPSLALPSVPSLPGATGSLGTLALAGAVGVVLAQAAWWRRARRVGGVA